MKSAYWTPKTLFIVQSAIEVNTWLKFSLVSSFQLFVSDRNIEMGVLNASRVRIIIFIGVLFMLWQIFRNWPGASDYHQVLNLIEWLSFDSYVSMFLFIWSVTSDTSGWHTRISDGLLWSPMSRFKTFHYTTITTGILSSTCLSRISIGAIR